MTADPTMRHVLTAADPVQAEAVRGALAAAGIEALVVVDEDGDGGMVMEILVPAGCHEQAREIIAGGNWPRLA